MDSRRRKPPFVLSHQGFLPVLANLLENLGFLFYLSMVSAIRYIVYKLLVTHFNEVIQLSLDVYQCSMLALVHLGSFLNFLVVAFTQYVECPLFKKGMYFYFRYFGVYLSFQVCF